MRAHGTASAAGFKRCKTKVIMVRGSVLIAAAALKTPTRNGYKASDSMAGGTIARVSPQGRPKRGMKCSAPLYNESVRTGGRHPKGANHRRGGPHRGPRRDTRRQ